MSAAALILAAIAVPLVGAVGIGLAGRRPNLRETVTLASAAALFLVVLTLLGRFLDGEMLETAGVELVPGVPLAFRIEPLGMIFALVASGLWIVNSIYSIGYMRGNNEAKQTRFYICFALALASTIGIAFAGNLLTLFVFYEALSLTTYPLVAHHEDEEAKRAGRTYLGLLMGTSIGLFLFAILLTWEAAGTLDFTVGGILEGEVADGLSGVLLLLYMYGVGKAALMPMHRWLPAAMVAPTPVSALLHAVAVVKAGVFCVVKIAVYTFGIDYLTRLPATDIVLAIAGFTVIAASVIALRQNNLKRRLAYSTVSQLSYVVLGAMLATGAGAVGAALHIVMHAFGKITLFLCAGAIYTAAHKTEVSQLNGLGRSMPITFAAFLIGALSVIGLPPLGGAWSKLMLAVGAAEAGYLSLIAVLMISSLLNVAYLLGPVARGFFMAPDNPEPTSLREAPKACLFAMTVSAAGCIALFFYADSIHQILLPMVGD